MNRAAVVNSTIQIPLSTIITIVPMELAKHAVEEMHLGRDAPASGAPAGPGEAKKMPFHSERYGCVEIMSVDDNVVNHMVVENSLEPRGFKVTVCMGGAEALEIIETRGFLPDLILLDCMMPEMTGYEMCEQLRLSYPCNSLPVIMVSAQNQEQDVVKGLKSGCNDYITKPFGVMELNARIDVQLKLKTLWYIEIQRILNEKPAQLKLPEDVRRKFSEGVDHMLVEHDTITVLVCDLVKMMDHLQNMQADQLSKLIHQVFDRFDSVLTKHSATRIMDDCYMVILGDESQEFSRSRSSSQTQLDEKRQAQTMLQIAVEMLDEAAEVSTTVHGVAVYPRVQMGIARGKAHSALIGMKMKYFTYFGKAVSEACDASANGNIGNKIQITQGIRQLLDGSEEELEYCAVVVPSLPVSKTARRNSMARMSLRRNNMIVDIVLNSPTCTKCCSGMLPRRPVLCSAVLG